MQIIPEIEFDIRENTKHVSLGTFCFYDGGWRFLEPKCFIKPPRPCENWVQFFSQYFESQALPSLVAMFGSYTVLSQLYWNINMTKKMKRFHESHFYCSDPCTSCLRTVHEQCVLWGNFRNLSIDYIDGVERGDGVVLNYLITFHHQYNTLMRTIWRPVHCYNKSPHNLRLDAYYDIVGPAVQYNKDLYNKEAFVQNAYNNCLKCNFEEQMPIPDAYRDTVEAFYIPVVDANPPSIFPCAETITQFNRTVLHVLGVDGIIAGVCDLTFTTGKHIGVMHDPKANFVQLTFVNDFIRIMTSINKRLDVSREIFPFPMNIHFYLTPVGNAIYSLWYYVCMTKKLPCELYRILSPCFYENSLKDNKIFFYSRLVMYAVTRFTKIGRLGFYYHPQLEQVAIKYVIPFRCQRNDHPTTMIAYFGK